MTRILYAWTQSETAACLNCGRPLTGQYCAGCGQKQRDTDPTLREFLHETTAELAQWDGKIPSTLKTLFFKPGALTLDFLAGRRARWLQPLRLYLICSLAFFVSKPLGQAIGKRSGNDIAEITITNPDGSKTLTPEALEEIEGGLPARVFGRDRLMRAAVNNDQLNREIDAVLPKALFMLLAGLRAPDDGRLAPPAATLSGAPLCCTAPSRGLVWCVCGLDDSAGVLYVRIRSMG